MMNDINEFLQSVAPCNLVNSIFTGMVFITLSFFLIIFGIIFFFMAKHAEKKDAIPVLFSARGGQSPGFNCGGQSPGFNCGGQSPGVYRGQSPTRPCQGQRKIYSYQGQSPVGPCQSPKFI